MDCNTGIEILFRGPHFHRHPESLQHLRAALAHDMQTHHFLLISRANDLVVRLVLLRWVHHGVIHSRETGLVDFDLRIAKRFARLGLCHSDRSYLGVGENDGGDVVVFESGGGELSATEEPVGQVTPRGDGYGRELGFPAHVPERVDVLHIGVLVVVRDNMTTFALFDLGLVQAEVVNFRSAPDGPEQAVDFESTGSVRVIVVECHPTVLARHFFDFGLGGKRVDVNALARIFFSDFVVNHGVKCAQDFVVPNEKVCFGAQMVEHARHFDRNISRAYHGYFSRLLLQLEEAVGSDAELAAGNILRDFRIPTCSDKNLFRTDGLFTAIMKDNLDFVLRE